MRDVFILITAGWLLVRLFVPLSGTPQVAHADPGELFVSPAGTGTACTQATPCALQTALDIAEANGEDDVVGLSAGIYEGNFDARLQDGKSLIVKGKSGATAQDVILDGGGTGRVLDLRRLSTGSSIRLERLTVQNGRAAGDEDCGGGIWISADGENALVNLEMWNCIVRYNQADWSGGGIFAQSYETNSATELLIANSLIYENQANQFGGAIDIFASGENNRVRAVVVNSTITGNHVVAPEGQGGGIRPHAYYGDGSVISLDLYNTIVHGNTLGADPQDLYVKETQPGSTEVNAYYCDIGSVFIDTSFGMPIYNPVCVLTTDPAFAHPGSDDYHLTSGSPCVDAGTTTVPDPPGLPTTDFEGDPRVLGAAPDIGADEYRYMHHVYLPLVMKSHP